MTKILILLLIAMITINGIYYYEQQKNLKILLRYINSLTKFLK